MAYTKIDELMWSDPKFCSLSDDGKLLFVYLVSCRHRNIIGLYYLPEPYAAFDLKWDSKRFSKGLAELLEMGLVKYNFNSNMVMIINFLKYNPLENPNQVKGAVKALAVLPPNGLDSTFLNGIISLNKPFMKPLVELLEERLSKQEDVKEDVDEEEDVTEDGEELSIVVQSTTSESIPYDSILNLFHEICITLPQVKVLSDKRKKALKARWKESKSDIATFELIFSKVHQSDFLSGRNGRWTGCNFDWILKQENFIKIGEGNYDNKGGKEQIAAKLESDVIQRFLERGNESQ